MEPRREPQRSCVACRTTRPKASLIRVARSPEGRVALDPSGRAPGRGAYVCRDPACLREAIRKGALARRLRAPLEGEELATLVTDLEKEIVAT